MASESSDIDTPAFVARVRQKDPAAIRTVVETYLEQILRAARVVLPDMNRAEDVAQATFVTFIETANRFEGRSRVRTWLFGILYRKIAENRRSVSRDSAADDIDQVVDARFDARGGWRTPPRRPERRFEDRELGEAIQDCLDTVPTRQRLAVTLREVEQFSTEEICKILDVTSTNLGVLLFRSRNRLRECLERKGYEG